MWEWSRSVAERAAAAVWTRPVREPAPTVLDPPVWTESSAEREGSVVEEDRDSRLGDAMVADAKGEMEFGRIGYGLAG
ncbi:MAG: hypothetical protein J2P18_08465 [Nocardia sp.]|nr:hypothetical protein [Nocardia sp.]